MGGAEVATEGFLDHQPGPADALVVLVGQTAVRNGVGHRFVHRRGQGEVVQQVGAGTGPAVHFSYGVGEIFELFG